MAANGCIGLATAAYLAVPAKLAVLDALNWG
jgi:hypothetical protein